MHWTSILSIVKDWIRFQMCFYADLIDLAKAFRTHVLGDIVHNIDVSLNNALPWDPVVFL